MSGGSPQVVIVGGGPAGLAAALELRRRSIDVVVLDREPHAGGIPRHSAHQGFGLRDLHRTMSGPRYAQRYVQLARGAGARVRTEAMVTGWSADGSLEVTSPLGRELLSPTAILLATGCRERPRSARLVPGSRPDGVMTTGTLQQMVSVFEQRPGRRALIVGAEHVSYSAILSLRHGGAQVVAMTTELPRHQSLSVFHHAARLGYRVPLWVDTVVSSIDGWPRVEEVELTDLETGRRRRVACDTVVFTADWIPDHELVVTGGIDLDPGTLGPSVDTGLRTSRRGVFAAGNVLHGAETADVAALGGRHAGAAIAGFLAEGRWPTARVPVICEPPLRWLVPNVIALGEEPPPRGRFLLRSDRFLRKPEIRLTQDGRVLLATRVRRLGPGRSSALPVGWIGSVDPGGGPLVAALGGETSSTTRRRA